MSSPFPGMDPYLEGAEWQSFHADLCSQIGRQLAPLLQPKYIPRTIRYSVTDTFEGVGISKSFHPDVGVYEAGQAGSVREVAVAAPPPPIELATVIPVQVPHVRVEIFDVKGQELITAIEVLSAANKRGKGYEEYLEKRGHLLNSTAHLIEIDLLRGGKRVPMQQPLPSVPYFVFLSRAERRPVVQVWPVQLSMQLPTIPIPLLPGDPDVELNLQKAFETVYDDFNYHLSVNYNRPPEISLREEEAIWVDEWLRAVKSRT